MIVYRICHPDYAHDLSGLGASLHGGRWNARGVPMLYAAETSSLAILEFLVHIKSVRGDLSYKLLTIETGSGSQISPELPSLWVKDMKITQDIGSEWILEKSSLLMKVPSVHNPLELNILINPRHPDFYPSIIRSDYYWFDGRLVKQ